MLGRFLSFFQMNKEFALHVGGLAAALGTSAFCFGTGEFLTSVWAGLAFAYNVQVATLKWQVEWKQVFQKLFGDD